MRLFCSLPEGDSVPAAGGGACENHLDKFQTQHWEMFHALSMTWFTEDDPARSDAVLSLVGQYPSSFRETNLSSRSERKQCLGDVCCSFNSYCH